MEGGIISMEEYKLFLQVIALIFYWKKPFVVLLFSFQKAYENPVKFNKIV